MDSGVSLPAYVNSGQHPKMLTMGRDIFSKETQME
jgi:hypothetical protein